MILTANSEMDFWIVIFMELSKSEIQIDEKA
jgi:hypothetical protein